MSKIQNNKCGEIFLNENDTVVILCTYCESFFIQFAEFMMHLKETHSNVKCEKNEFNMTETNKMKLKTEPASNDFTPSECIEKNMSNNKENNLKEKISKKYKDPNEQISELRNLREKLMQDLNKAILSKMRNNATNGEISNNSLSTKQPLENPEVFDCEEDLTVSSNDGHDNKQNDNIKLPLFSWMFDVNEDSKKCRFCGEKFLDRTKRVNHERIHTGEKPFECETCSKCFRTKSNLKTHFKLHQEERPYKCEICNAAFKEKSNFSSHILRHSGQKRHHCSYCEKSFYQTTEKRLHERTHTGEKPYQCFECGKCFLSSGQLTTHNRKHTGEKPYKCKLCDKRFTQNRLLKDHMVVHSTERPLSCNICNATFSRKKALRSHEKIHADVPQYICKVCGKGFKQNPGLYSHMKSHGELLTK